MPLPFDATGKFLVQARLADWIPLSGRTTTARVEVIDADLATVTAAADRVVRVHDIPPWLLHIELQSSRDDNLESNLHLYNTLLYRTHAVPVQTLVVLLRRSADMSTLTGLLQRQFPGETPYLLFRYQVVRVWQAPVDTFLNGGLGLVPLAPLSAVTEADLPGVIARMDERIRLEASPEEAGTLWTATDVLMGLRYPSALVAELMRGIHAMKDSVTYQAIVEEGKVQALQNVVLQLGRKKFGSANEGATLTIRSITDVDRLSFLTDRILDVSSWEELLRST